MLTIVLAAAATVLAPHGGWRLAADEDRCLLTHDFGAADAPTRLSFQPMLATGGAELTLSVPATLVRGASDYIPFVEASVGGDVPPARLVVRPSAAHEPGGRAVALTLPPPLFQAFGQLRRLTLKVAGTDLTLPLPDSARARALLRICADDLLKSWGIEPAAVDAAKPPAPKNGPISRHFRGDMYPPALQKAKRGGLVGALAMIDRDGRMTTCRIVRHAEPQLDALTCRVASNRVRWTPATDAAGRPVAGLYEFTVRWLAL